MIIMKEHYILYMEKKQVQRDVNHIKNNNNSPRKIITFRIQFVAVHDHE